MFKRMAVLVGALAAAGTLSATTAQAAVAPSGQSAVHQSSGIRAEDPPAGYVYEGTFYWHDSCEEAGKGGIPRAWSAYVCIGDGWPWDSYNLYVKYNN